MRSSRDPDVLKNEFNSIRSVLREIRTEMANLQESCNEENEDCVFGIPDMRESLRDMISKLNQ